jgi:hypothetical protein
MRLVSISSKQKQLCLSEDEFWILRSSIVQINQEYHTPRPPSINFCEKFGYSLEMHNQFEKKLMAIEIESDKQEICFFVTGFELDKFNRCLKEILSDYVKYEFDYIIGCKYEQSKKVFDDLQVLLSSLKEDV